jgi:hypothetical protein
VSQDPQKHLPPDEDETDEVAERLRALSAGEHAEVPSPPSSAFDQVDFAAPPPAPRVARPAVPPGSTSPPPATPPSPTPARRKLKSTPAAKPKPPKPARPEQPTPASDLPPEPPTSYSTMPLIGADEDDDQVMVPAPPAQHLGPRGPLLDAPRSHHARSLLFRRTMIPILLTFGLMLPTLGILWFTSDPASTVRASGLWLPVTLIVLGAIMLLLAIINMAQVKHLLRDAAPAPSR